MFKKRIAKRVVVIGSKGFVGSSICEILQKNNITFLEISRNDVNFDKDDALAKLSNLINEEDFIIIAAAQAPVKNNKMLLDNISMMNIIINSISEKSVKRVVYISSDAVYSDSKSHLNENSAVEPQSLHGIMHLTREIMLKQINNIQLSIIRPTLIYGNKDPHNGYGPNQFFRLAQSNKNIILFGKGEELRDHVSIDDVAQLTVDLTLSNFEGVLNIASGKVKSFREVAILVKNLYGNKINVLETQRVGEMPHGGYRSFDISKLHNLYPNFKITSLEDGVTKYFDELNE